MQVFLDTYGRQGIRPAIDAGMKKAGITGLGVQMASDHFAVNGGTHKLERFTTVVTGAKNSRDVLNKPVA